VNGTAPTLPPRLAAVALEILPGSRVADIGSDHGRLPLALAARGLAAYCLATERDGARLARIARPEAGTPSAARIAYRAGDGLDAILPEDRIDTVVLSGMGGRTIVRLLAATGAEGLAIRRLVLQPRSEAVLVRRYLSATGWRPVSERLPSERRRFHLTIAAERGDDDALYRHPALDRDDLLAAGPLLVRARAPELFSVLRQEVDRLEAILARTGSGPSKARARSGHARALRVLDAISTRGG